jgi:hypothetical protein
MNIKIDSLEGPMAGKTGSQMGMGGSTGLEGSYVQGAGSEDGMTSVSSGFEGMPERGDVNKGTGSPVRRTGTQTEPNR